jgi:PST family polysaccharide transporter
MHSTAFLISIVCSVFVSLGLIFFNKQLAVCLLKDIEYSNIFKIFGFTLVIFSVNSFFIALLNGYKEIKKFVSLNIVSSIVSLIFTSLLIIFLGLYGALLSYVTAQTVVFLVTIFFVLNSEWFKINDFLGGYNVDCLKKLGKFSLMAFTTTLAFPVSQIFIRNYISDNISINAAGYWQGVWKISEVYLLLITTSLSVYYLPRLSEIKDIKELRKEIFTGYKIIMPIVIVMALIIFLLKDFIILILFSDKFTPMSTLFGYQLLGDIFKIFSWLLSYLMVAKAMTKYFITTEILSSISLILISIFLIQQNGLIGTTQAFALNYFLYSLIMLWIFRNLIFQKETKKI